MTLFLTELNIVSTIKICLFLFFFPSYMWSFEKAHLSMVQIITGQLVESFDEEFRTLYARSCVPSSFAWEESARVKHSKAFWKNGIYQHSVSSLASISSQRNLFGTQDKIHKLDSSYFINRGIYTLNERDRYNVRNHAYKPHFVPNFNDRSREEPGPGAEWGTTQGGLGRAGSPVRKQPASFSVHLP